MKVEYLPIGLFILALYMMYYDTTHERFTDMYKYEVIYDDGYKTTYSHTDIVEGTCIETMNGRVCGTFYIEENYRYKGE